MDLAVRLNRWIESAPNSSRHHLAQWVASCAATTPAGALVLDAGAGDAPYRHLFSHARYESADFEGVAGKGYGDTTYVCDLTSIPVEDGRFDRVICNQVLEHVPDPLAVVRELHRVARPGAAVWLSAPLFYEEHEQPYDFFRYTQFAWRRFAAEAGFDVVELGWLEGHEGALAYHLNMAARAAPLRRLPFKLAYAVLARWHYHRDVVAPDMGRGMCKNYRVVFRKPAETPIA